MQGARNFTSNWNFLWRCVAISLRILLNRYLCKIQHVHELKPIDFITCQNFENWLFQMEDDVYWLLNVLWADKAHFFVSGCVNEQNYHIWAIRNSHSLDKKLLMDLKMSAWFETQHFLSFVFFSSRRSTTIHFNEFLKQVSDMHRF